MIFTISIFSGVALMMLLILLSTKKINFSIKLRFQSFIAAVGLSIVAGLMYLLFPIGLVIIILVVLILLVSLILAARLERESTGLELDWELPNLHTSFEQAATTEETILQSEPVTLQIVEEEPVLERKQSLMQVGADESEELMTGRRRRIQDEEEL